MLSSRTLAGAVRANGRRQRRIWAAALSLRETGKLFIGEKHVEKSADLQRAAS
jgi:hypothetical protein